MLKIQNKSQTSAEDVHSHKVIQDSVKGNHVEFGSKDSTSVGNSDKEEHHHVDLGYVTFYPTSQGEGNQSLQVQETAAPIQAQVEPVTNLFDSC